MQKVGDRMLFSLAVLFLSGMVLGKCFEKINLPSLLGMLIAGILVGPTMFNLLDDSLMLIAADLRKIALIIILTRAGINLDLNSLKKVGRPALMLCFTPALFEIAGLTLIASTLLKISYAEAALLASVLAAVSPAVIVPRMLKLMDENKGCDKSIPQMVMVGASVDDVLVIVLFSVFSTLVATGDMNAQSLLTVPTSIVLGIGSGLVIGYIMTIFFNKFHLRDSSKVLILISIAFLLVTLEDHLSSTIGYSGLLAVMTQGIVIRKCKPELADRLSNKFSKLWVAAEIWLFVLVGATVNIQVALNVGVILILIVIIGGLLFRSVGVFVSVFKTPLNMKERLFVDFAYLPKATVQAAIGGVPLAMGFECGELVLAVAVISILFTAPLGAILIDCTYKKWLN